MRHTSGIVFFCGVHLNNAAPAYPESTTCRSRRLKASQGKMDLGLLSRPSRTTEWVGYARVFASGESFDSQDPYSGSMRTFVPVSHGPHGPLMRTTVRDAITRLASGPAASACARFFRNHVGDHTELEALLSRVVICGAEGLAAAAGCAGLPVSHFGTHLHPIGLAPLGVASMAGSLGKLVKEVDQVEALTIVATATIAHEVAHVGKVGGKFYPPSDYSHFRAYEAETVCSVPKSENDLYVGSQTVALGAVLPFVKNVIAKKHPDEVQDAIGWTLDQLTAGGGCASCL
jgi:hypothetical protein